MTDPIIFQIKAGDYDGGGKASRALKEHLKKVGADGKAVRRAMIASYEAEMNVVIHSVGGQMTIQIEGDRLSVEVKDEGPGIADLNLAMREGYSTAPAKAREYGFGAGMGLPNIKRNSDEFHIQSQVGEGTTLQFKVLLKQPELSAGTPHSVHIRAALCRLCKECLRSCPTRAVRVRNGSPQILEHLCIDCNACIGECPTDALSIKSAFNTQSSLRGTLVVSGAFLAQFGTAFPADVVLQALKALGFERIHILESWSLGIQQASVEYAHRQTESQTVIVPTCPAVLNLIQLRFPSLIPHVAPFLTPLESAEAMLHTDKPAFMAFCPSQRSRLREHKVYDERILIPSDLRSRVLTWLNANAGIELLSQRGSNVESDSEILSVCGLEHVMGVLNDIEDGLLRDIGVVELLGCDQGCFGSPLLSEDCYVAANRWRRCGACTVVHPAVPRLEPLVARAGIRLDENMLRAIMKLKQMQEVRSMLPGRDCGVCGAPTCDDLAEDVVLNRADMAQCAYLGQQGDQRR